MLIPCEALWEPIGKSLRDWVRMILNCCVWMLACALVPEGVAGFRGRRSTANRYGRRVLVGQATVPRSSLLGIVPPVQLLLRLRVLVLVAARHVDDAQAAEHGV